MKTVKVTYTVQPSFVEQNKVNVATFINDLKKLTILTCVTEHF